VDGLVYADGTRLRARHETFAASMLPLIEECDGDRVRSILTTFTHHVESAPYLSLVPESIRDLKVVHVIRDGRRVVQSGLNHGWYQRDNEWNWAKPKFPGGPFEQSCHYWVTTVTNCEQVADVTFRLEDLVGSAQARAELLGFIGVKPSKRPFPKSNRGTHSSSYAQWSEGQQEIFERIAGPVMDRYYPAWRQRR
jgi:hypothetical protein